MILDAHGWPQWDVWILPFYLFAAFAALKNRWFVCGCLLATGAMFKGQLLFVAPFFVLWPLWQKRWNRALRVLAGFIATAALIASPWLLRTPAAWITLVAVTGFSLLLFLQRELPHQWAWISGIAGCAAFVIGVFTGEASRGCGSVFCMAASITPTLSSVRVTTFRHFSPSLAGR
jgi:uncharacterized membrane protein